MFELLETVLSLSSPENESTLITAGSFFTLYEALHGKSMQKNNQEVVRISIEVIWSNLISPYDKYHRRNGGKRGVYDENKNKSEKSIECHYFRCYCNLEMSGCLLTGA